MIKTRYEGVFYRDTKDGKRTFYIRYRHNGKQIRQVVGLKAEGITPQYCKRLRDQTLVQLRLGEDAPIRSRTNSKTLGEVATECFKDSDARSIKKLESVYNTHLKSLASKPIASIDASMINELRDSKKKQKSIKTGRILAPKTVNNILATLSIILKYAYDHEEKYIKNLPVINKIKKISNTRERFLSKDEVKLLLATLEKSELPTKDRLLLFTRMALGTGARLGSILTIKGKDINRERKTISIKNHKTSNKYTAFIPTDLMEHIPALEPQQKLIDISDAKQIQRPLQGILNDLFNVGLNADDRLERVVIHTLRHTFASILAINKTPLQEIQKRMDHSDIQMTVKYAKLDDEAGRDAVENMYD